MSRLVRNWLTLAAVAGFVVAMLWPGHGPFDSFRDRIEANGAPLPFEQLMSEGPFPEGCAESRECADAAMLLTALMAEEPIRSAGNFEIVTGAAVNQTEKPLWFHTWKAVRPASASYYDVAVTVPGPNGEAPVTVGYLRYGESGESFFDWTDGRHVEFRPKRMWRAGDRVAERFHESLRDAYEGRTRLSDAERREVERRLGLGDE